MATQLLQGPGGEPLINPRTGQPARLTYPDSWSPEQISAAAQRAFATLQQTQPQAAAEVQQQAGAPFTTAGAEGLQTAGGMLGEFAKQEALPIAATAAVGSAFPPAGPAAGVAARTALGLGRLLTTGATGVGAAEVTRKVRGQPPMKPWERVTEFAFSMTPEPPMASAVDASTTQRLVNGLADVYGKHERADTGVRLQRNLFKMRHDANRAMAQQYDNARNVADRLGLVSSRLDPATVDALNEAMTFARTLPDADKDAMEAVLTPILAASQAGVKFSTLSRAVRDLSQFESRFLVGARYNDIGPIETANNALREEAQLLARGTPVEKHFEKAVMHMLGEHRPTLKALRDIEAGTAFPSDVVRVLSQQPDRLRLIMRRLPIEEQDRVRGTYFTSLLERTQDLAGVDDLRKITAQWNTVDPNARKILAGGKQRDVNRIFEQLESKVRQEKTIQQIRLAQSGLLVVSGSAIGAALQGGDVGAALPVLLGTAAGVQVLARIMANAESRRFFRKGLETPGRVGARAMLQALSRGGVDFVAPEARLPGMTKTPGTVMPFEAQPQQPATLAAPPA